MSKERRLSLRKVHQVEVVVRHVVAVEVQVDAIGPTVNHVVADIRSVFASYELITSRPKGNDRSPESQHAQKGFFQQFRAGCSKQICSRAGNSKVNGQMWPEFELGDFTPVLVASECDDDDPIKNNCKVVISCPCFLHYKSMGGI